MVLHSACEVGRPSDQCWLVAAGVPIFAGEPVFLFGLPVSIMGGAVLSGWHRSRWLGTLGLVVGGATFTLGVLWFVGVTLVPELVLWAVLQPLEWLWFILVGVAMWRQSVRN